MKNIKITQEKIEKKGDNNTAVMEQPEGGNNVTAILTSVIPLEEAMGIAEAQEVKTNGARGKGRGSNKSKGAKTKGDTKVVDGEMPVTPAKPRASRTRAKATSILENVPVTGIAPSGIKFINKQDIAALTDALRNEETLPTLEEVGAAVVGPVIDMLEATRAAASEGDEPEVGGEEVDAIPDNDFGWQAFDTVAKEGDEQPLSEASPMFIEPVEAAISALPKADSKEPTATNAEQAKAEQPAPRKSQSLIVNRAPVGMIASFLLANTSIARLIQESEKAITNSINLAKVPAKEYGKDLFTRLIALSNSDMVKMPIAPVAPIAPQQPVSGKRRKVGQYAQSIDDKKAKQDWSRYEKALGEHTIKMTQHKADLETYQFELEIALSAEQAIRVQILNLAEEFKRYAVPQPAAEAFFSLQMLKELKIKDIVGLFLAYQDNKLSTGQFMHCLKDVITKHGRSNKATRPKLFSVRISTKSLGFELDWSTELRQWIRDGIQEAVKFSKGENVYVGTDPNDKFQPKSSIVGLTNKIRHQKAVEDRRSTQYAFPSRDAKKAEKQPDGQYLGIPIRNPKWMQVQMRLDKGAIAYLNGLNGSIIYGMNEIITDGVKDIGYGTVVNYDKNGNEVGKGFPAHIIGTLTAFQDLTAALTLNSALMADYWEKAVTQHQSMSNYENVLVAQMHGMFNSVMKYLLRPVDENDTRAQLLAATIKSHNALMAALPDGKVIFTMERLNEFAKDDVGAWMKNGGNKNGFVRRNTPKLKMKPVRTADDDSDGEDPKPVVAAEATMETATEVVVEAPATTIKAPEVEEAEEKAV